eukprot:CAMPEP_0172779634 /NCGR_PEP_ID=MMETSP1074-20121228/202523_1 /TAXON_ID=2916 /ORGANISM="Ceratium fusus, Strain PA161109" /LENGTH=291 /DNA_ID=CAMNT_0013616599 /DNA_START=446 /DNA_END=1326 /DNA_ORIENTATION=-
MKQALVESTVPTAVLRACEKGGGLKSAAIDALAHLAEKATTMPSLMAARLEDTDWGVKHAAVEALVQLAEMSNVITAVAARLEHIDRGVRLAMLEAPAQPAEWATILPSLPGLRALSTLTGKRGLQRSRHWCSFLRRATTTAARHMHASGRNAGMAELALHHMYRAGFNKTLQVLDGFPVAGKAVAVKALTEALQVSDGFPIVAMQLAARAQGAAWALLKRAQHFATAWEIACTNAGGGPNAALFWNQTPSSTARQSVIVRMALRGSTPPVCSLQFATVCWKQTSLLAVLQ